MAPALFNELAIFTTDGILTSYHSLGCNWEFGHFLENAHAASLFMSCSVPGPAAPGLPCRGRAEGRGNRGAVEGCLHDPEREAGGGTGGGKSSRFGDCALHLCQREAVLNVEQPGRRKH